MAVADISREAADAELKRRAIHELSRRDLSWFCRQMDHGYQPARHTKLLCDHLEAVERGDITRLAVFMPPRHSKTYHVSERFPAWFLGRDPTRQVILASYGAELAEQSSRKVRGLVSDERWPFPGCKLSKESTAVNRWHTTKGGIVTAAGVGGALTGFGAHALVVDDPVKGRAEADSETYRESAWQWWTETARTRLMPRGAVVLCQTRWHEDDMAGRVLNSTGGSSWTVLNLPAIAEDEHDALGRQPGEALWPEWYDVDALQELRDDTDDESGTSRGWNALYQQHPTSDEGGMFKRDWFHKRWTEEPRQRLRVLSVDSAFKTGVSNDYSAFAVWSTDGIDYHVLDAKRRRVEFHDLKRTIVEMATEYRPHALLIEDTASGQSAIQELRRETNLPIVAVKVTASKESRAESVTGLCEAGKVVLPAVSGWVSDWINQHAAFPTGKHDDWVDTTSMALGYLREKLRQPSGPRKRDLKMSTGAGSQRRDSAYDAMRKLGLV